MTAQPHAHVRFRRAIERRALWLAEDERRSLPIFIVGAGLRPEEWLALRWSDVDSRSGVLTSAASRRTAASRTTGSTRACSVASRSAARVLDALGDVRGIGEALVCTGDKGGPLNLHAWRRDEWYPALEGAPGLPKLVPYAMRHTFASFAIAAGVSLFYLARLLGTSVEQIDRT